MTINALKAEILTSQFLEHGFFGKQSGYSDGVYDSLNCSDYVGDDPQNVAKNLELVKNKIGAQKLITLKQCSENKCIDVDNSTPPSILTADAMVTSTSGIAIGILAADCAPILFFDDKNMIIAVAHAGWRGAALGVLESTLHRLVHRGADLAHTKVAIGPCIGKNSYEVNDDFHQYFRDHNDCFGIVAEKLHFDLPRYCQKCLRKSGVPEQNIQILPVDTAANNRSYFSYRAACRSGNGVCGRNISVICLKDLSNGNNLH
ncbi:MAG: polyphenol oxidase family protein [Holosporaceae bacterium]|jgi:YfiH family protein|nr:polyphenol oxidase family protein [Holosporaceae bacterium]